MKKQIYLKRKDIKRMISEEIARILNEQQYNVYKNPNSYTAYWSLDADNGKYNFPEVKDFNTLRNIVCFYSESGYYPPQTYDISIYDKKKSNLQDKKIVDAYLSVAKENAEYRQFINNLYSQYVDYTEKMENIDKEIEQYKQLNDNLAKQIKAYNGK